MKKVFVITVAIVIALRSGRHTKRELADKLGYSKDRIWQLVKSLRQAGVVRMIHGRGGGYELAVPFGKITLGIINNALEQDSIPPQIDWLADAINCNLLSIHVSDMV